MGKYMMMRRRRAKTLRKVSLMELELESGVLTRAKTKTLALQQADSYIQLRSRRLLKQKESFVHTNPNKLLKILADKDEEEIGTNFGVGGGQEASFGENTLEIEAKGRTTRETTPCSLIRDPDTIKTPGSSTKSTTKSSRPTETKYGVLNTTPKPVPSTSEVEEFFIGTEKQQQRLFIEKYNFDPVNDRPLHGRYEWVKLDTNKKS